MSYDKNGRLNIPLVRHVYERRTGNVSNTSLIIDNKRRSYNNFLTRYMLTDADVIYGVSQHLNKNVRYFVYESFLLHTSDEEMFNSETDDEKRNLIMNTFGTFIFPHNMSLDDKYKNIASRLFVKKRVDSVEVGNYDTDFIYWSDNKIFYMCEPPEKQYLVLDGRSLDTLQELLSKT